MSDKRFRIYRVPELGIYVEANWTDKEMIEFIKNPWQIFQPSSSLKKIESNENNR